MSKNKSIEKNALLNMLKQICSIGFPLLTFSYASRVLGTEYFGRIAFVRSIINYFSLISMLGISAYAIREGARIRNNTIKLNRFISEVFTINIFTTVVSLLLLFFLVVKVKKIQLYLPLFIIQSFIIILPTVGSDWVNTIFEDYYYLTIRYIIIQVLCVAPIFIFVKKTDDYLKYAFILVVAGYGGNIINLFYIRKYAARKFIFSKTCLKHISPILVLFSGTVAVHIYLNSDVTMLGLIKSDSEAGIYSAVSKIYTIIKELINSITIVIIPQISEMIEKGNSVSIRKLANKIIFVLMVCILPIAIGILGLSKEIILLVVGSEYYGGNSAFVVLGLALPFAVLSCFFSNAILIPFREEKKYFIATCCAAIINIVINFAVIPLLGVLGAACTTLLAEIIVFFITGEFTRQYIKLNICRKNIRAILMGLASVVFILIVGQKIDYYIYKLLFCIILSIAIYSFIIIRFSEGVADMMKKELRKIMFGNK